ncbi:response regulator [Longitalea luteola]|uniref:response regulator n=1 Tax=Longitalea luteola TaxID=2812563 RepID=UPI001A97C12F|nr:response regulator [Longitalea luteola]
MKRTIKHICLAEDDPDDFYIFSNLLHEVDSSVKLTWFQTCEDLLRYLKNGSDLPCLIVLDMNMPKMDGQTCLVTLKKEITLRHIPVIILSTAFKPGAIDLAIEAGANKYYQKPYSPKEFKTIISEILAMPVAEQ